MPSPRHLSRRHLLLASLTGSERRGNSVPGARPRAVAPSSQRTSSPACIPDWEREEGKLRAWRPASCCRPVTLTCSFHKVLRVEEIAVSAWHLLQRPTQRTLRFPDRPWTIPSPCSTVRRYVNSHQVSLMATHIRIQSADGPKERSRGRWPRRS